MSAPQSLLQAAIGRLAARVGSGLADTAAGLAVLAQDAPARLQQEWQLFWEEVELEAERLERGEAASGSAPFTTSSSASGSTSPMTPPTASASARAGAVDPQEQIDALRAQVAELARRLERPAS